MKHWITVVKELHLLLMNKILMLNMTELRLSSSDYYSYRLTDVLEMNDQMMLNRTNEDVRWIMNVSIDDDFVKQQLIRVLFLE